MIALRTRAEDNEIFDVLVWPNFVHIAIVDGFVDLTEGTSKAVIAQVQSGPQVGNFDFVPSGAGPFRLAPTSRICVINVYRSRYTVLCGTGSIRVGSEVRCR